MGYAATITDAGITAPSFADVLTGLQDAFRAIYGNDVYIEPDSQDGQFLALLATAINDCNDAAVAIFNAFAPSYAQGTHLASLVKLNGLTRLTASNSTAVGKVTGQVGTVISNGSVKDANGNIWLLPAIVTIPTAGEMLVTVTAKDVGAIYAPAGSINKINTPQLGWQSFISTVDATPGAPVETDAALRKRQAASTQRAAQTPVGALVGELTNLTGVTHLKVYENVTATTDANGIPPYATCVVIEGGDLTAIATTIGQKKTPGGPTYGTTTQTYIDPLSHISYPINFYICGNDTINVVVGITPLTGYRAEVVDEIKQAISDFINSHDIGQTVDFGRLYAPAYLNGAADRVTYKLSALTLAKGAASQAMFDIPIAFNSRALCTPANVTVNVAS